MPIITNTMISYDPKTFVITTTDLRPAAAAPPAVPLARTLAGVAAAGLATRLAGVVVELALSRRPR